MSAPLAEASVEAVLDFANVDREFAARLDKATKNAANVVAKNLDGITKSRQQHHQKGQRSIRRRQPRRTVERPERGARSRRESWRRALRCPHQAGESSEGSQRRRTALAAAMKAGDTNAAAAARDKLARSTRDLEKATEEATDAAQRQARAQKTVGDSVAEAAAKQKIAAESAEYNAGAQRRLSQNTDPDKQTRMGTAMGFLGGKLALAATGLGSMIAIGAGLTKTISIGLDYTTTMNTLGAVTQATAQQMDAAGQMAQELGNDITLPGTSAVDAAAAMTELAKGGFTVEQSMSAAKGTLQLAAAAQIDAASAATIQANALNTFGLSADYASKVSDVLANAANAKLSGNHRRRLRPTGGR